MNTINLQHIIDTLKLDVNELSNHLFPNHKHSRLALNRVIQNKSLLDASQISKLSAYTGIPIGKLYSSTWEISSKNDILTIVDANFKAELNLKTWTTKVFDNNSLFHQDVLHSPGISLSDYLNLITEIINKYKSL